MTSRSAINARRLAHHGSAAEISAALRIVVG
jgi:hypothetical protein